MRKKNVSKKNGVWEAVRKSTMGEISIKKKKKEKKNG